MAFDPMGSVFRITKRDNADDESGTGFVIHIDEKEAPSKQVAYLLTCAHVVDALGKENMSIEGNPAKLLKRGYQTGSDLAIITVDFSNYCLSKIVMTVNEKNKNIEVYGYPKTSTKLVPLKANIIKNSYIPVDEKWPKAGKLRVGEFSLDPKPGKEPDNIKKGYSGSPIVNEHRVCAVAHTRRTSSNGRVGSAIPVWYVVKIWPEMPDKLGEQLFGANYWFLLQQVRSQTEKLTCYEYQKAFEAVCQGPDKFPAEYSLWGCAVSLLEFESDSDSTDRLRAFLSALGISGYTVNPSANAPSGLRLSEPGPPADKATPSNSIYRQLIIRIVKCTTSRRDDVGGRGGDRYWIEAHSVELDACAALCCEKGGKECVPFTVRTLPTIYARRTEEERRSGLKELLQEEIPDILAAFGSHNPDMVQFVIPEELFGDLIVTDQIDQVLVREGREPLAEWRPTIFSGARLSHPDEAGRDLLDRFNSISPLHGPVIGLRDPELTRQVRGQLKSAIVAVLSTPEAVHRLLPDAPYFVPFVLLSAEKADAVVDKVAGLHCMCRLAHELHARQYDDDALPERLPIIANTPNVSIRFAEAEEPIIVGN